MIQLEDLAALTNRDVQSHVQSRWERKLASSAHAAATDKGTPLTRKRALASNVDSPNGGGGSCATPNKACASGAENTPAKASKVGKLMTPSNRQASSDRFIATRTSVDFDTANYKVLQECKEVPPTPTSMEAHEFKRALSDSLGLQDSRVLAFKKKAPAPAEDFENPMAVLYRKGPSTGKIAPTTRIVPNAPEKILDAPDLMNDFYVSPLDWSCANQLGVALGASVYLWSAATGAINELCALESPELVTSIRFVQQGGGYLAVGTTEKKVGLWDVETQRLLRSLNGHSARVSCLAWNGHVLTSAGRDASIVHHDVRVQNHVVGMLQGHTQEVCSLQWSPDGTSLASGSNDNTVCIWDAAFSTGNAVAEPRIRLTHHQACVKAMAWNPHQRNVLVTGGGTSDRTIRVWSTAGAAGVETRMIDTGSQVCSLQFNPNNRNELLSSHGFSENQLTLWKFPDMTRIKDLTGHTARVLHTAVSPDGTTVCSASADETLRLWKCFGPAVAAPAKGAAIRDENRASAPGALRMSLR